MITPAPQFETLSQTAPLGVRDFVLMSAEEKAVIERISTTEFPFVWSRLLMENKICPADISALELEFKRFFALVGLGIKPLAMVAPNVDEVWHQFILFTAQYAEYCIKVFGRVIHHQPNTPETPVPKEAWANFLQAYNRYFGELPSIWTSGMDADTIAFLNGRSAVFPKKWSGWTG